MSLVFLGATLFCKVATLLLECEVWILRVLGIIRLNFCQSNTCEMVSHCSNFYFPDVWWDLSCADWPLDSFSMNRLLNFLWPLFSVLFFFVCLNWFVGIFKYMCMLEVPSSPRPIPHLSGVFFFLLYRI